jgi:hypothetical protein
MPEKIPFEDLVDDRSIQDVETEEVEDTTTWAEAPAVPSAEIVRIEEVVQVGWSGVSSCDHSDRIQAEVRSHLQRWIEKKLYEHRNWRYLRAGAKASSVRCGSWKDPWTGKRSCGCSGGIPFYIDFAKP